MSIVSLNDPEEMYQLAAQMWEAALADPKLRAGLERLAADITSRQALIAGAWVRDDGAGNRAVATEIVADGKVEIPPVRGNRAFALPQPARAGVRSSIEPFLRLQGCLVETDNPAVIRRIVAVRSPADVDSTVEQL